MKELLCIQATVKWYGVFKADADIGILESRRQQYIIQY